MKIMHSKGNIIAYPLPFFSKHREGSILASLADKSKLISVLFLNSKKSINQSCCMDGKPPTLLEAYLQQNCTVLLEA